MSAAAGSGKTAVLIERIVSQVTDPVNPVNIDEFVIVTFTRLAAAQMKEKLQAALEKKLEEDPENVHLQRQVMLLPVTQISTIHSFCGYIIQNYFHQTGVDPSYRVANDNELNMIKSDVLAELLEEEYTNLDESFVDMAKMARFIKSDTEMEKIILKLYNDAMSEPFPQDFFERMRKFLACQSEEELEQTAFIQKNLQYAKNMMIGIYDQYEQWIRLCYTRLFWKKSASNSKTLRGFLPMKRCGNGWGRLRLADCLPNAIPRLIRKKRKSLKREERILKIC